MQAPMPTAPTVRTVSGMVRGVTEGARFTARAFAAKGAPAYVYRFSYVPASMQEGWRNGVPHAAETPDVFDTLGASPGGRTDFPGPGGRPDG